MDMLIERLKALRAKKGTIDASDLDALLAEVVAALSSVSEHTEMVGEIKAMAEKIRQAKADMSAVVSEKAGQEHIKGANLELDEVIKGTEEASNRIMDAAEKIQALAAGNVEIAAQVTELFEACSFQDITGQRIRKVLGLLADVEKGIQHLMVMAHISPEETSAAKKQPQTLAEKEKELLRGPQLSKDKPSQDDIDKLFASS